MVLSRMIRGMSAVAVSAALALAGPAAALGAGEGGAIVAQSVPTARLEGQNRYETMARIVRAGFPGPSDWAVVATGEGFADALCASALAGARGCPVVLTAGSYLSPEARSELSRMAVSMAYVVGGPSAVSDGVVSELESMGVGVTRLYGADRYATSVAVAREVRSVAGPGTVAVATGDGFADALSLGPWCYATASPVICVPRGSSLSGDALDEVAGGGYQAAVIAGGEAAVPAYVEDQLEGVGCERLAGADRYQTGARVAEWSCTHGLSWAAPAVATGRNFPDALAGAALQGSRRSPLLLADQGSSAARDAVAAHAGSISSLTVLGGEASLPASVEAYVAGEAAASEGEGVLYQGQGWHLTGIPEYWQGKVHVEERGSNVVIVSDELQALRKAGTTYQMDGGYEYTFNETEEVIATISGGMGADDYDTVYNKSGYGGVIDREVVFGSGQTARIRENGPFGSAAMTQCSSGEYVLVDASVCTYDTPHPLVYDTIMVDLMTLGADSAPTTEVIDWHTAGGKDAPQVSDDCLSELTPFIVIE